MPNQRTPRKELVSTTPNNPTSRNTYRPEELPRPLKANSRIRGESLQGVDQGTKALVHRTPRKRRRGNPEIRN